MYKLYMKTGITVFFVLCKLKSVLIDNWKSNHVFGYCVFKNVGIARSILFMYGPKVGSLIPLGEGELPLCLSASIMYLLSIFQHTNNRNRVAN